MLCHAKSKVSGLTVLFWLRQWLHHHSSFFTASETLSATNRSRKQNQHRPLLKKAAIHVSLPQDSTNMYEHCVYKQANSSRSKSSISHSSLIFFPGKNQTRQKCVDHLSGHAELHSPVLPDLANHHLCRAPARTQHSQTLHRLILLCINKKCLVFLGNWLWSPRSSFFYGCLSSTQLLSVHKSLVKHSSFARTQSSR